MAAFQEGEQRNPALDFLEFLEAQLKEEALKAAPEIRRTPLDVAADAIAQATADLPPDPYKGVWGEAMRWYDEQRAKKQWIEGQPEPLKTFHRIESGQEDAVLQLTLRGQFNLPKEWERAWDNILAIARRPEHPQGFQLVVPSNISLPDKVRYGLDSSRTVAFGLGDDFKFDTNKALVIDECAILTRYYRKLFTPQDRLALGRFR